jgi:hypothetical protein
MANLQDYNDIEHCRSVAEDCGMVLVRSGRWGRGSILGLSMDTKKFPNYTEDNEIFSATTVEELTAFMRGWMARPMHDSLGVKKEERG